MDFSHFTRRQLVGAGLGLGVASAATLALGAAGAPLSPLPGSSSPASPELVRRRTMLMKGLLREGLQVSSLKGTFYAVENGQTTPLHGAVMSSFTKHRKLSDGSIETRTVEIEWYTDLDGVIFDEWKNPITQKTVPQPPRQYFRNSIIVAPDFSVKSLTVGDRVHDDVVGWRQDGDDLWMFNKLYTMPAPKGLKGAIAFDDLAATKPDAPVATELATYHARVSEIDAPGITDVRVESYHSCEGAYRPWQEMGKQPGYLLLLAYGHTLNGRDQLPKEWLEKAEKEFPELLKSPESFLDA